jgi:AraC-like DNA-binding protein
MCVASTPFYQPEQQSCHSLWSSSRLDATLKLSGNSHKVSTVSLHRIKADACSMIGIPSKPKTQDLLAAIEVSSPLDAPHEVLAAGSVQTTSFGPGLINIVDAGRPGMYRFSMAFDLLQYSVTRKSLDVFTASEGLPKIESFQTGFANDPVLYHFSRAVLPAIENGFMPNQSFEDWFVLSILTRMVERYARMSSRLQHSGGLSPEILRSRTDGRIGLGELAQQCGLSNGHFARVFRHTFGMPVHRYLLCMRIDYAKELIHSAEHPLSEIARLIGFTDQATFTDSFSRIVGISPGRYRRQMTASFSLPVNNLVANQR